MNLLLTNLFPQMLYMDPAAVSVLLTSITAIVLAVGASVIIVWRRLKKKVEKTLKIDPNSGKEVEEELVDVWILINQIIEFYEVEPINFMQLREDKLNRTLERIESGYYENDPR